MIKWYRQSWSKIVKELKSNSYYGLYSNQIESNRKKYGSNRVIIPSTKSFIYFLYIQLKEFWVLLFIFCFGILCYFKMFFLSLIVIVIMLINIICIALKYYKNEKNIKELQRLNLGYARIIRNGRTIKVPSEELVVGDIVIVGEGESVPADIRIIESNDLKVDECSVTGEKFFSDKYEPKIEEKEIALSNMKNMLFKSSTVVKGDATGIVVAVGMKTQIVSIVKLFLEENKNSIPFKSKLNDILNMFVKLLITFVLASAFIRYSMNENIFYIFKDSVFLFLSSFPIGFCLILCLISNILLDKLKRKNVAFRNISSIEKFSKVSAICTDKVGGFSENRMNLVRAYGNSGFIDIDEENLKDGMNESLYRMLNIGLLCNGIEDDPIEISIARFSEKYGIYRKEVQNKHRKLFQISFDTERRMMTTVNKVDKKYRANIRGAVDSILDRCTHILKSGIEVPITEKDINEIRDADISMSNDSLGVLGFAYRNFNYEPSQKENIESNLVFVGLIGFDNKLKETAADSIKKASILSIKPIVITEDSKLTALSVGKKLGIVKRLQQILSGVEMDNMDDEEFKRIGEKINIFSRINSNNKIKIVNSLKSYGYTTAITGWKITDLPSLKIADIGITNTNSNIVKKLSDIFIPDIDFMNLLNLIESSRKIIGVIRKIILYILTCSMGFMFFLIIERAYNVKFNINESVFFKAILFNMVNTFLSSLALICQYDYETAEYNNYIINKDMVKQKISFIMLNSFLIGFSAFLSLKCADFWGCKSSGNIPFIILNICSVFFVYSFSNSRVFKNKFSNFIVAINFIIQIAIAILVESSSNLFSITYWLIVLLFSIIWFIFCLFYKLDRENFY